EERRARAVQMRRSLGSDAGEIGALDPAAIEEVFSESWPVVRDPDELHDALLTLIVLSPVPEWQGYFDALGKMRRVKVLERGGQTFWLAAERSGIVESGRSICDCARVDGIHWPDDGHVPGIASRSIS